MPGQGMTADGFWPDETIVTAAATRSAALPRSVAESCL